MRQRKQLDGGLKKVTKCLQNDANGLFEGQQNSLIASLFAAFCDDMLSNIWPPIDKDPFIKGCPSSRPLMPPVNESRKVLKITEGRVRALLAHHETC
jgi:hypothetical protein